ncbi:MAG TPA: tetratricopeptide repeat protein [Thermoanaerobaculia bacterium]|nr:tetratricopeptide repeat protein [Thermoanaerobaculia bacterium]
MRQDTEGGHPEIDDLKPLWHLAVETGRLEEALEILDRALVLARAHGDARQIDFVICDRAAVAIELGHGTAEVPRLREILVRNADIANCRVAAYNIARFHELNKDHKKALFYARIARDRSELLHRRDWLASSHNLIGNTLLAESFVDRALEEYERALEFMPLEPSPARARILDNLGYCRVLQGRYREGFSFLYQSLRILRRFQAERYQISIRLDLCFAHLETGRYRDAWRHGVAALELAEKLDEPQSEKNALYLLGETAHLSGDMERARGYFARLQQTFFPEATYLPGFLLAVDVRKLVNLHA